MVLCDAATVHAGRLNILGIFDTMYNTRAPLAVPECSLALSMRFEHVEAGEKILRIALIDSDGRAVTPVHEQRIKALAPPDGSHFTLSYILYLRGVELPHFGEYSFDLAVNGRSERSTPLWVRQAASPEEMRRHARE